jgi:Single-strand binding protein family
MRVEDSPSPSAEHQSSDPIATALGVSGEDRVDIQAGRGRGYGLVNEEGSPLLSLETFEPDVVRLATPAVRIETRSFGSPTIAPEGVVWAKDASFLSLSKQGELTLHLAPSLPKRPETPKEAPGNEKGRLDQEARISVFARDSGGSQDHFRESAPAQPEKEERVALFGRLGRDPLFRVTANEKLIGQFPLAVRLDEETVKWETVIAHGPRAEKLRDQLKLKKGQSVEVIGYRHEQKRKDRQGNERVVEEIYVVAVIPR